MSDTTASLSDARWQEVSRLFGEALERPPDARSAFLERATEDRTLRDEVAGLLRSFAERGAGIEVPSSMRDEPIGRVGPYRLERRIAEGGMGVVWLASRADAVFKKQVAVKLVKRGMDSRAVLRRFERERQVLADLDHANVARLLDGGIAEDGRPYLVMEHVDGVPLDVYCRERSPALDERLRLLTDVCDGVAAAHEQGIVHRDLKPGNVLVTADGRVKVVDFGIAKVLGEDGGDSLLTLTAERLLTPRYASPEQVEGHAVTPATDVYALGVLLYELLTGEPPYDLAGATAHRLRAIIGHEQPRPPSQRASAGERAAVRGELDVIALHALAKDPESRYLHARAMAEDLRRRLSGRPILARRETARARTRRWVRRHARLTAVTAVVFFLLVLATAVSVSQWRSARGARDEMGRVAYTASLGAAEAALSDHRVAEARGHLDAVPERLRGFAWRHLLHRVDTARERVAPVGDALNVAYSPDGEWLSVGSMTGHFVRLFDVDDLSQPVATRHEPWKPDVLPGRTRSGFHPTEPRLAAPHVDGVVRILSVPELDLVASVEPVRDPRQAAYDPSGAYLAVTAGDRWLRVYRHPDYELVAEVEAHDEDGPMALAFDADGGRVATGSWDETARVWSFPELRLLHTLESHSMVVHGLAFSPDGRSLVTTSLDGTLRVHALDGTGSERILRAPGGFAVDATFDPRDGTLWTSLGSGGAVVRWDLDASSVFEVYPGPTTGIETLALAPDGRSVAAGSLSGAWIWDVGAAAVPRVPTTEYSTHLLDLRRDGSEFFLGQSDGRLRRFRTADLAELPLESTKGAFLIGGGLVRSGLEVVAADLDGNVRLWDSATGRTTGSFAMDERRELAGMDVQYEGVLAAVRVLYGDTVTILDLEQREVLHHVTLPWPGGSIQSCAFRPGTSELWVSGALVRLSFDVRTGDVLEQQTTEPDSPFGPPMAFDASGARLAYEQGDRVVVQDVETGRTSLDLSFGARPVGFAFHPTESLLAVGLRTGSVPLVDLELGDVLVSLSGHTDMARSLRFTPDGRALLTAGADASLRVWRAP